MVVFNKRDLQAMFILFAVLYLFDGIGSGFLVLGIIVFLLMVVIVLVSEREEYIKSLKNITTKDLQYLVWISIGLVFLGVLVSSAGVLALGFLIGMLLLFVEHDTIEIELWELKVNDTAVKRQAALKTNATSEKGKKK